MATKSKPKVSVSFTYASCTLMVSQPAICPLCQQQVAAGEVHECASMTVEPAKVLTRMIGKESQ